MPTLAQGNSGCRTYLEPSDHEAIGHELRVTGNSVLKESEDTPPHLKAWYQPMYRHLGDKKHERDLSEDGAQDIIGLQMYELIAVKAELFFETRDVCIICRYSVGCF